MSQYRTGIRTAFVAVALLSAAVPVAHAELYGGIEIGAKGVKATAVDITGGPEGYDARVLFAKTANTTLSAGLAKTGKFDRKALEETVAEVERFFNQLKGEFKVSAERLHIVASSGLFVAVVNKPELLASNRALFADAIQKATSAKVDFLTGQREAELSVRGIVPRKYLDSALLIDIGSGDTKGGFQERPGNKLVTVSLPYGTVTVTDRARKRAEKDEVSFDKAVAAVREEAIGPDLKKQLGSLPGLDARKKTYLSGGAVWALATLVRPAERGPFVEVTARDVARYRQMVADAKIVPEPDLSGIDDEQIRQKAAAELRRVRDTYSRDNLAAGAEILQALFDELGNDQERKFYFARNGYLGWILAYVEEKAGVGK